MMKKICTRRRRALRRICCFLLVAALFFCGRFYGLTPRWGLNDLENTYALDRTTRVAYLHDGGISASRFSLLVLSENDDALLFGATRFHLLIGWYGVGAAVAPREPNAPVTAGYYDWSDDSGSLSYGFGCMTGAARVQLLCVYSDFQTGRSEILERTVTPDDCMRFGGEDYFAVPLPQSGHSDWYRANVLLTAYDENGSAIVWTDPDGAGGATHALAYGTSTFS
ncbi:MAG: hypothetical protein PHS97_01485 [Oscillospiraceae bacterium]|nr:hypothetical protein [Oscillospiraceae bacterium]